MDPIITILFAYRDRDIERLQYTFSSLKAQTHQNFKVIFVDYGSEKGRAKQAEELIKSYPFATYYYVAHPGLLWNKSKAFNYAIKKSDTRYILTADVDLIFHSEFTGELGKIIDKNTFYLFKWGYLDKKKSARLNSAVDFDHLRPNRNGSVNGMVLAHREALEKVHGLDEFFHFYGAEDEDLFSRLEAAGYVKKEINEIYIYHIWHESFSITENKKLTAIPRIKNIMRINYRHFIRNKEKGLFVPEGQNRWGEVFTPELENDLYTTTGVFYISNIKAFVEHFLNVELLSLKGEVIKAEFFIDPYYHTLKYRVKKFIGKQTQPYLSLKEVNDLVLKKILFNYRDHNYNFSISRDFQKIHLYLDLRNK